MAKALRRSTTRAFATVLYLGLLSPQALAALLAVLLFGLLVTPTLGDFTDFT